MMRTFALLILITGFFSIGEVVAQPSFTVIRLAHVRTVYVDENSFRFTYSSCGTKVGGMMLPCPKHAAEREEFLVVLKRWLGKSGFTLVEDRKEADGIVQGTLHIDDFYKPITDHDHDHSAKKNKHEDYGPTYQTEWSVGAWIINQDGQQIWNRATNYHPEISYGISSRAKVEGKTLAKAIKYDFKKGR